MVVGGARSFKRAANKNYQVFRRWKHDFLAGLRPSSEEGVQLFDTVVLVRDQTCSVTKQVSVAVGWVKIKISLMAQLKGLTAKFKLM